MTRLKSKSQSIDIHHVPVECYLNWLFPRSNSPDQIKVNFRRERVKPVSLVPSLLFVEWSRFLSVCGVVYHYYRTDQQCSLQLLMMATLLYSPFLWCHSILGHQVTMVDISFTLTEIEGWSSISGKAICHFSRTQWQQEKKNEKLY